jgi:hypothetical protein
VAASLREAAESKAPTFEVSRQGKRKPQFINRRHPEPGFSRVKDLARIASDLSVCGET